MVEAADVAIGPGRRSTIPSWTQGIVGHLGRRARRHARPTIAPRPPLAGSPRTRLALVPPEPDPRGGPVTAVAGDLWATDGA